MNRNYSSKRTKLWESCPLQSEKSFNEDISDWEDQLEAIQFSPRQSITVHNSQNIWNLNQRLYQLAKKPKTLQQWEQRLSIVEQTLAMIPKHYYDLVLFYEKERTSLLHKINTFQSLNRSGHKHQKGLLRKSSPRQSQRTTDSVVEGNDELFLEVTKLYGLKG